MGKQTVPTIQEAFTKLHKNYTPTAVIMYMDFVQEQSVDNVLENCQYVYIEPTKGADVIRSMIVENANKLTLRQLEATYLKMNNYITKATKEGYENADHLRALQECLSVVNDEVYKRSELNPDSWKYLMENTIAAFEAKRNWLQSVTESIGNMGSVDGYEANPKMVEREIQCEFGINFVKTFMDQSSEINMESFTKMMQAAYAYEKVIEGPTVLHKAARSAALGAEKVTKGIAHGVRDMKRNGQHVKAVANRVPQHIDNLINNTVGQIQKMDQAERRNRIIEGGYKVKLFKLIRNAALLGGAWLIHPALAAIGFLAAVALDAKADNEVRNDILDELEDELKMVNEKIEDSKGDSDKQKKYQLMRIKNKLEHDIQRIKYRLRDR